jgi:molybdopterin-guanine dinucleotide biosynthesis protein A
LADRDDDHLKTITLAILAGGEGSRMGIPKGMLQIRGRPILTHILASSRWPGPTLLVTSPGRESPPGAKDFDAEVVDPAPGLGPMRGVLTALQKSKTEAIVISAVDMPAMNGEVLRWIAQELRRRPTARAILVERLVDAKIELEPLPCGFRRSARDLLTQRIATGKRSLCGLAGCDGIETARAPQLWTGLWENLNYPADLSRFESNR